MTGLAEALRGARQPRRPARHRRTGPATLDGWKRQFPLRYSQDPDGPLKPQYVIERLSALTGGDAIVVAGVGQHQMHAAQHYSFTKPRSWINSGGAGTMGFAVPAAMGAQVGRPGELVVAIDGDGCFQMTAQELATCAIEEPADQGADLQQRLPRDGPPVAGAVLRRALLLQSSWAPPSRTT